jgi:hypothetical protein
MHSSRLSARTRRARSRGVRVDPALIAIVAIIALIFLGVQVSGILNVVAKSV